MSRPKWHKSRVSVHRPLCTKHQKNTKRKEEKKKSALPATHVTKGTANAKWAKRVTSRREHNGIEREIFLRPFFFFLSYGTKKEAPEMRFCNLRCRQGDFVRRGASVQTSGCKKSAGKTHHDLEYGEAKSEKRAIIFLCSLKYLPPLWRRILAKSTHASVHKKV